MQLEFSSSPSLIYQLKLQPMADSVCIEDVKCESVDQFLSEIDPANSRWGDTVDSHWVFRGQWDATWALTPAAWRKSGQDSLRPLVKKLREYYDSQRSKLIDRDQPNEDELTHRLQVVAEIEAVRQFSRLADELGHQIFDDPSLSSTKNMVLYGVDRDLKSRWPNEATALAQHHGVPTRLLDWTRNPQFAAHFAVAPKTHGQESMPDRLAVWAYNPLSFEYRRNYFKQITVPRFRHSFLHAQDGLFLHLHQNQSDRYFSTDQRWPSFDQIVCDNHESNYPTVFYRITLPTTEADKLVYRLWQKRITISRLMPTLDNVTSDLKLKWEEFDIDKWDLGLRQ